MAEATTGQETTHGGGVLSRVLGLIGPGVITGAADDDPSGIATYAQAGAGYGYGLLWVALLTFPMMVVAQYISSKIGLVRGRGLAAVIGETYPAPVLYLTVGAVVVANTINLGTDLGAMAAAVNLFLPIPIAILVTPLTLALLLFLIFGSFHLIQNTFKWLTIALFAYIASSFLAKPDWFTALRDTVVPSIQFNNAFLALVVGALGTNVSPYLFFWQAVEEAETSRAAGLRRVRGGDLKEAALDTTIGMFISNVTIYFVTIATAATLFKTGHHTVASAAQAAAALKPVAGSVATILWAVGIVGVSILGVPTLAASAADGVATAFSWRHGLAQQPRRAWHFYAILAAAMLIGMGINFLGVNPIQALVITAVINGLLTPPLLVLIMLLANKREVLGKRTNGLWLNLAGWVTAGIMGLAAIALIVTTFL